MPTQRISASSYSNTAPLIWSFLYGSNHGKVELILDNAPARSTEMLTQNRVDAALVPVIASQLIEGVRVIPDVCVGAQKKVQSVCLVTHGRDLTDVKTVFGSLTNYQKGGIQVIRDDPKNYAFSNVFEVASKAKPYERVAVGKNFEYVIECVRADATSPWFTCDHDEFLLVMDGMVEVRLQKPGADQGAPTGSDGAALVRGEPTGPKMGHIICRRGHMALLPRGAAYQFHADKPGVLTIQTVHGPLTVERWAEICETRST